MRIIVGSSLFALASCAVWGQTASEPLSFDVASVKPSAPQPGGQIMRRMSGGPGSTDPRNDPGMITWENVTLKMMLTVAYNVKDYQVEGPEWIDSTGYDVTAKMPRGTTMEQMGRRLQTLLAERFKVTLHRETRQMPVYALVVGKSGSKMKEVDVSAVSADPPPPAGPVSRGALTGPPPGRGPGGFGGPSGPGIRMMMTPNGVRMSGYMTMPQLVNALSRSMARPVLDETELTKTYDVDISWMPDELSQPRMGSMPPPPGGRAGDGGPDSHSVGDPAPTLAQALQEKLGLKLETRKSAAEVLIVDRAEKVPVEN